MAFRPWVFTVVGLVKSDKDIPSKLALLREARTWYNKNMTTIQVADIVSWFENDNLMFGRVANVSTNGRNLSVHLVDEVELHGVTVYKKRSSSAERMTRRKGLYHVQSPRHGIKTSEVTFYARDALYSEGK